jgi:hypothetical protein
MYPPKAYTGLTDFDVLEGYHSKRAASRSLLAGQPRDVSCVVISKLFRRVWFTLSVVLWECWPVVFLTSDAVAHLEIIVTGNRLEYID